MPQKQFSKDDFDKVKRAQAKNWEKVRICTQVGYGRDIVTRAMAAPTWPQFCKNEKAYKAARKQRRDATRLNLPGYDIAGSPALIDPNEGKISKFATLKYNKPAAKEMIGWIAAAAVLIVTVVIFLIVVK